MDSGPLVPASNPVVREIQPSQDSDLGRPPGRASIPISPSQESPVGESLRILHKRKWIIIGCLVTIFSVVAIASLKMTHGLRSAAAPLRSTSPMPTSIFRTPPRSAWITSTQPNWRRNSRFCRAIVLALQVIRELNLDRQPGSGRSGAAFALFSISHPTRCKPTRHWLRQWSAVSRGI